MDGHVARYPVRGDLRAPVDLLGPTPGALGERHPGHGVELARDGEVAACHGGAAQQVREPTQMGVDAAPGPRQDPLDSEQTRIRCQHRVHPVGQLLVTDQDRRHRVLHHLRQPLAVGRSVRTVVEVAPSVQRGTGLPCDRPQQRQGAVGRRGEVWRELQKPSEIDA